MEVFVVLTHYENGIQESGVFASKSDAVSYIAKKRIGGSPIVVNHNVVGNIEKENTVFTASQYDRPLDGYNFVGIYGNYDQAKKVAGDKGLVLNREINSLLK